MARGYLEREIIPVSATVKEVGQEFGIATGFALAAAAGVRAVRHAVKTGNVVEAAVWGVASVGSAALAAAFGLHGVEAVGNNLEHNRHAETILAPQR